MGEIIDCSEPAELFRLNLIRSPPQIVSLHSPFELIISITNDLGQVVSHLPSAGLNRQFQPCQDAVVPKV